MATFLESGLATVNAALAWLIDLLLLPVIGLPPLASLVLVSVLTAAAMLPVIARTSDQKRMAVTRRRIHAALFEIRLFNDDPRAVFRALGDALRYNALYLRLSIVPLLWMAIPLALLVTQLQAVYGYTGLAIGVPALVKLEWHGAGEGRAPADVTLEAPAAIRVETGAVQLAASNEALWRIVPVSSGDFSLTIESGGESLTKSLRVSDRPARRSPLRGSTLVDQFLYPSEPPLASSRTARISVTYPEAAIDVFGLQVHWLIVFVVVSMAAALALARWFGVTL